MKKETEVEKETGMDYSVDVPARYLDTHKRHAAARNLFNEKLQTMKQQPRHQVTKSLDRTAIKPKSLQLSGKKPSHVKNITTLLSAKKGNFMRELTVEDVYQEEKPAQDGGRATKEIMKHI